MSYSDPGVVRTAALPFARTLERQIEDIMAQAAPRRRAEAVERGVVSVLFVSISGYVALCEEIEPPELGTLLRLYAETVLDSISQFLGTVQVVVGDTIMATWNAHSPQPDHALLAVNSAIGMVERVDDLCRRLGAVSLPAISYGAGINTGDALLRHTVAGRSDGDVVGDTVNVARLLSGLACNGGILMGEGTHVSIGNLVPSEPAEFTSLAGKRKTVRAFRVKMDAV